MRRCTWPCAARTSRATRRSTLPLRTGTKVRCTALTSDLIHYVLPKCDLATLLRQNDAGNTPLHWAAFNGHLKLCELLIDRIDALETQDETSAHTLRAEEDKREHERHLAANKKTGESEAEQKAELEHHDELQRERAIWDIRNAAGHGPMTEAQKADREDIVQMMLGRLAQHDKADPPPEPQDEAAHIEERTEQLRLEVDPSV